MSFTNDLKVGIRQFGRNPGSMLLAIMAFSLGLGLVGLMLTLVFGVIKGHPKDIDFDNIFVLQWDPSTEHLWKSGAQLGFIRPKNYREIEERQEVFENLSFMRPNNTISIVVEKYAERFTGAHVSDSLFKTLGLKPHIGSFFEEGDDRPDAAKKAVISYKLWKNQFDSRESIIGRSFNMNGIPTTLIGVAPEGVDFPSRHDVWINETANHLELSRGDGDALFVLATLKEDQTIGSAVPAMNTIAKTMADAYPETNTGYIAFEIETLGENFMGDEFPRMVYLLLACSLMVLLIACTNVANLTLSRATTRVKELAIRASLGGKRGRLVMQMLVEGFAIAFFGGLGGLIIAIWTSRAIWASVLASAQANPPIWMNMDVDMKTIGYLALITLFASIVASIVPAIRASKTDVNEILKDNSRGASSLKMGVFSKLLVLAQLSVSCALLIATSAMVSGAKDAAVFEPPYDPSQIMTARFDLPENYYPGDQRSEGLERLQTLMENNPALEGVGFTSALDMIFNWNSRWQVRGREAPEGEELRARNEIVSDNYFDLLDIPILYGRGFEKMDQGENAQEVCVINELLAKRLWPDNIQDALGQQIRDQYSDTFPWITIIGIVPDTKMAGPGANKSDEELGGVYRPMSGDPQDSVTVFAKTNGNPTQQANHIRSILNDEDQSFALYRVKTVETAVEESQFGVLFFRNLFGMFGIAAFTLASIGIYGVMDFSIRQRFQEFSIRQALGAGPATIFRHIFKMSSWQIALGLVVGSALGYGILGIMADNQMAPPSTNPMIYLLPIALIIAVSSLAIFAPARYVINTNLSDTLRGD
ncbi:ABC transporter permease [Pelagicoccus sp. SDUM812002]|uniref:ABC transporter permease n=1 Tax=Pelagicoccus sp. SDUM812002 TaxID=3041266 RepID=UPI00281043CD|nr:ABC transporter permease [Pelagicoccus sp. SDUM812002]MDQ8184811.1 ABC transporter permease [Pelagicoccus sp. SDUM812002]